MAGGCKIEWVSSIFFSIAKMDSQKEIELLKKEISILKRENELLKREARVAKKEEKVRSSAEALKLFIESRIREPRTMEEKVELRSTPTKLNEVKNRIASWKRENHVELSSQETINALTEKYGEPEEGKYWYNFRVFAYDEEVKDWDDKRVEC